MKDRETVVTYSFPPEENVTESVSYSTSITSDTSVVTSKKTKRSTIEVTVATASAPLFIDINKASHDELCRLNGIGDNLAGAIIRYREEKGGFNNIEEIMNVYGIGENLFNNIEPYIYVENPFYPSYEEDDDNLDNVEYEDIEPNDEQISDEVDVTEPQLTLEEASPIDLNNADAELLMLLPHVDEEIAEKIIELRDQIHVFSHPYELLYIDELSRQQVAEIVEYVSVDNADESDN